MSIKPLVYVAAGGLAVASLGLAIGFAPISGTLDPPAGDVVGYDAIIGGDSRSDTDALGYYFHEY